MPRRRRGVWGVAGLALAVASSLAAVPAWADDEERLAASFQAVMLKKIFPFDHELENKAVKVAVLYSDDAAADADRYVNTFAGNGIAAKALKASAAAGALGDSHVAYALPGAMTPALKDACIRAGVLTVSGEAAQATRGEVSVALARKANGKPEIVINLKSMKAERHSLAPSLLGLATVIQ